MHRRHPGWREPALFHWCGWGHSQVSARALLRPLGRGCTARKVVNADLLENTMQAWMGWPGFGMQGAEEGEMPLGYRAASAVTNSPWAHPLLPSSLLLQNILLGLCTRVWNWHQTGFAHREKAPGQYIIRRNTEKKSKRIWCLCLQAGAIDNFDE